jgi:hypothetical protein
MARMKRASEAVSRTLNEYRVSLNRDDWCWPDSQNEADQRLPVRSITMIFMVVKESLEQGNSIA